MSTEYKLIEGSGSSFEAELSIIESSSKFELSLYNGSEELYSRKLTGEEVFEMIFKLAEIVSYSGFTPENLEKQTRELIKKLEGL